VHRVSRDISKLHESVISSKPVVSQPDGETTRHPYSSRLVAKMPQSTLLSSPVHADRFSATLDQPTDRTEQSSTAAIETAPSAFQDRSIGLLARWIHRLDVGPSIPDEVLRERLADKLRSQGGSTLALYASVLPAIIGMIGLAAAHSLFHAMHRLLGKPPDGR
jgi:hypothetical protein